MIGDLLVDRLSRAQLFLFGQMVFVSQVFGNRMNSEEDKRIADESLVNPVNTVDRRFATTLARGLCILRAYRAGDSGLTNLQLSQRTNLPRSTVSRLTFTLKKLGYLSHSRRHDVYRPGPALLALGNVAAASVSFVDQAESVLQGLANCARTLVVLAVRDEDKMLLIKTWQPEGVSSAWVEVGYRIAMAKSSSGQALLAAMSEEEFDFVEPLFQEELIGSGFSASTLRDHAYRQLLDDGFVTSPIDIHFARNVNAVSIPFRSIEFDEPISVTCGATLEGLTVERMNDEVGPLLRHAVVELERLTGQSSTLKKRG